MTIESTKEKGLELLLLNVPVIQIEKPFHYTIGLLEIYGRYIESYMLGLNHEFSAELFWRQYPTDHREQYFRWVWSVGEYIPMPFQLDASENLKAEK